jgi:nucleotide-binding universal stress UspA family protein
MQPTFSRILLAFDDSAGSRIALEYACALAHGGAELTIAHAVDEDRIVAASMTATGFSAIDPVPLIAAVDERGAQILRSAVDACVVHGVRAESVLLHDSAGFGVAELQRDAHFDLIVVGTHGRQGLARVFMGSAAQAIVRASDVPVLLVSGHARSPKPRRPFDRALVAVDGSEPARRALVVAGSLGAQLTLCNVIDSRDLLAKASTYAYDAGPMEAELHAASRTLLASAQTACGDSASIEELVTVEGEPAATVEHTAMQHNCDLIVMGSHARHGLGRLVFGSIAEAVVRMTVLPVLIVPTGSKAAV